jgi:hypothetical protein
MYHDQGLPVLKHAGFGQAVNVTLGLPIMRTSVDHGTALDLAGTRQARTRQPRRPRSSWRDRSAAARGAAVDGRRPAGCPFAQALRPALPARSARDRRIMRRSTPAPGGDRRDRPGPRRTDRTAAAQRRRARRGRDRPRPRRRAARRTGDPAASALHEADALDFDFARWPGARPAAARGRQPALQHLDAAAVPPAAHADGDPRHARHAAEGGRRARSGAGAGQRATTAASP